MILAQLLCAISKLHLADIVKMALQASLTETLCLSEQFARLPVELLIEIASYLGQLTEHQGMSDGPRSAQASAFLMALMSQSSHLRRAARPLFWSEVHVSSKTRVSGSPEHKARTVSQTR